ncbi:MAG: chorismate synthase [Oscillospiraceae bacterium]|nr:chorismate synthase [Oscillospiraceae bacterium]
MSSCYGNRINIQIFGQSHSAAVGVVLDGIPAGITLDTDELRTFMKRRAPGNSATSTARKEADEPEILSGLAENTTCGAPIAVLIRNTDTRSADYRELRDIPRPSHADYSAYMKFGEAHDIRGGGHFSGRLTAPLCAAGGICLQILQTLGISITARIVRVGKVTDTTLMEEEILKAKQDGDSVGGVIECIAVGVPAGLGDPIFNGMENRISGIVFGIPGVKGIEFGSGFAGAERRGSENNDSFFMENGAVRTRTNHSGGILGGITNGMPVIFRAAFKPTPSIAKEQNSVSLSRSEDAVLHVTGRHDPCIVPRAVPCVEAAAAIAIYDAYLQANNCFYKVGEE